MIRFGIAGCGWAGTRHAAAIHAEPRAELVAVADADEQRRRASAETWGISHTFADFRELCTRADLDAVIIALPHDLHREASETAARAGLHILCEKPIAIELADADAIIDAAAAAGVRLMVAESARFEPLSQRIEALLMEGAVGHVVHAHRTWLHQFSSYDYGTRAWLNSARRAGGGQWLLNGVHLISTLCSWMGAAGAGPVQHVLASEFRTPDFAIPAGMEASVNALLTFSGGAAASISMALEVHHHDAFNGLRLYGTGGIMVVNPHEDRITLHRDRGHDPQAIIVAGGKDASFNDQLAHFVDCLEDANLTPITNGLAERNTLAVVRAGYHSMAEGVSAPVTLRHDRTQPMA